MLWYNGFINKVVVLGNMNHEVKLIVSRSKMIKMLSWCNDKIAQIYDQRNFMDLFY